MRQRIRFFQQLAVLVRAGLPIRASIDRLHERLGGAELVALSRSLGTGERLGEAFAAARFMPFESNLVVAGERGGQLETIFDRLAQFWQRELDFRQALVRPLVYPIILINLAVMVGSGIQLLSQPASVVVPQFILHMALLYAAGFVIYTLARLSWASEGLKRFWLRVPIVGRALRTTFAYRWITALRLEFTAGISLYKAVGDAWRASGFVGCDRIALEGEEAMRSGASLSSLVVGWRQLPTDWVDFIETGEVSGGFEAAFTNLEEEAARNWRLAQQRMADWLPKVVYFIALLIVGAEVISDARTMLAPTLDMEKQLDDIMGGKS